MNQNLPVQQSRTTVEISRPAPTAGDMLEAILAAIKSGEVTAEKVAAMDGAMKLCERMQDKEAEKQFAAAFIGLMREMPKVQATKIIPSKDGTMRSSFAPFEEIDAQARPLCLDHGFTYSFSEGEFNAGRITKICTLTHSGGHSRSNPFTVRVGSGPPGCSESQADGAAHSYAKRGALCDALNIVVHGIDNDARVEGGVITQGQADDLRRRVRETASNESFFLKFAGAKTFEEISTSKYAVLDEQLRRKEKTA
jgi:hypothetical protein